MSVFTSSVSVEQPVSAVYAFLADMNNHGQLMPDNIINWSSTTDEASFEIQNITSLSLRIKERVTNTSVRIIPSQQPPFEMELFWLMVVNGSSTAVTFTINAQLNMMMKMLASAPLQKLADEETRRLSAILAAK